MKARVEECKHVNDFSMFFDESYMSYTVNTGCICREINPVKKAEKDGVNKGKHI